jgi:hypothetical protein
MKRLLVIAACLLACGGRADSTTMVGSAAHELELRACEYIYEDSEDGGDVMVDPECLAALPAAPAAPPAPYVLGPCEYVIPESEDGGDIAVDFECLENLEEQQ